MTSTRHESGGGGGVRYPLDFAQSPAWRHPVGLPRELTVERTLIMGVLNVTPDSFSDGGAHNDQASAIAFAAKMRADGADIIDVGGESTRPGGARVSEEEELGRTIQVVRELSERGIPVSIDTMRATVASEAVNAGAVIVNDVSGGLADPAMHRTVAGLTTSHGTQPVYVAMHWRAHSDRAVAASGYSDIGNDVAQELSAQIEAAMTAGIRPESIVADPGFGFSKTGQDNWDLFDRYRAIESLGLPILVGVSRKRFLTALGVDRDAATAAISGVCQARRTWAVRVHDVAATRANVRVIERLMHGSRASNAAAESAVADRPYGSSS